jgi:hypothetical protein
MIFTIDNDNDIRVRKTVAQAGEARESRRRHYYDPQ